MENMIINHLAVWVAAVSAFMIGGLWYSPVLFNKQWMKANRFSEADVAGGNPGVIFGISFVMSLIIAYNLAFFLGDANTNWSWGLTAGLLAGAGWVVPSMVIVSLFERRPFSYMLVNGGYIVILFAVNGLIIGAWR